MSEQTRKQKRFFISYRRSDSAGHAGRLYDHLKEYFGDESIFFDVDTIEPGIAFKERIKNELEKSDVVLVLIGNQWLQLLDANGNRRIDNPLDYVRFEVETALNSGIVVIPVLLQGAAMPSISLLPEGLKDLSQRNATKLSDERWYSDVKELSQRLRKALEIPRSKREQTLYKIRNMVMALSIAISSLALLRPIFQDSSISVTLPLQILHLNLLAYYAVFLPYVLGNTKRELNRPSMAIIILTTVVLIFTLGTSMPNVAEIPFFNKLFTYVPPVMLLAIAWLFTLVESDEKALR